MEWVAKWVRAAGADKMRAAPQRAHCYRTDGRVGTEE
jgi:hypothetical protein